MPPRYSRFGLFSRTNKILVSGSLMLFFWSLFDGIISYVTPLLIEHRGFSNTSIGLIISTSSLAGAIFDFLISKFLRFTHYLRLFLLVLVISLAYPLVLWSSHSAAMFIFAMGLWGLYYDLMSFAIFDFAARSSKIKEHCRHIGIIGIFKSLGYLIAPLIAAYFITDNFSGFSAFPYLYLFLIISLIFYLLLFSFSTHRHGLRHSEITHSKSVHWLHELRLWGQVGRVLYPVLIFNILLYIFEATFWTIGPIFSESFPGFKNFGGIFMALYTLPVLFVNWFVGPVTDRFGKKRTAYWAFFLSSLFLIPVGVITGPYLVLILVFLSSLTGSIAWPAISGAYVDYIAESGKYENEIIGLSDFSANAGYVIGPALAGTISDLVGVGPTFFWLGLASAIIVIILTIITPRHIRVTIPAASR